MTTLQDALDIVKAHIHKDASWMDLVYRELKTTGLLEHGLAVKSYHGLPANIHAIEATIFDNWPDGKHAKGKPLSRYAITIKAWSSDNFRNRFRHPDARLSGDLRDGTELLKSISRKKGTPLNPDYIGYLTELASQIDDIGYLCALLTSVHAGDGKKIQDQQFVMAETGAMTAHGVAAEKIMLKTPSGKYFLPAFVPTDAMDRPLTGNAVFQSRCSVSNGSNWQTGDFNFRPVV